MDTQTSILEDTDLLNILSNQLHLSASHVTTAMSRFIAAVDWTEPFVLGVIAIQLLIFIISILTRKNNATQLMIFGFLCLVVFTLSHLNTFLQQNWRSIATQNYFDDSVFFMSTMVGFPSFFIALYIVVHMTFTTAKLVITLKRKELKQKIAQVTRQKKDE
eukprot:GDKJ01057922.1.p1 GENE.GDKJ01057922.1~~GDKJ01057922.1.p1  ORF type:complete len:169 (-),score=28.50 GDKJ01057922.1:112-594(-)